MEQSFWQQRWSDGQIGFHEENGSRFLRDFGMQLRGCRRVLVPMCGKTRDIRTLAAAGHEVVGIEFVPDALEQFAHENPDLGPPQRTSPHGFPTWTWPGITLLAADIFMVSRAHMGTFDGVFDRAAMVALHPEQRPAYGRWLEHVTADDARALVITLEYDQEKTSGPPFSVSPAEVRSMMGALASVSLLADEPAETVPRFKEQGIGVREHCHLVRRFVD